MRSPVPFVFTLHDLIHLDARPGFLPAKRLYFETVVRSGIRRAGAVLTVSEFSRGRIVEWSGCSPEMIVNVGNGVSPCFHPNVSPAAVDRPYFLHVGSHAPHKNIGRLFRAMAISGLAGDCRLLLTGASTAALRRQAAAAGVADVVSYLGLVPDDVLARYYRGALALILPSLSEGFGLPVIEAMACATPVVASLAGALPETAGGAALLVDPLDVESLADSMKLLAGDAQLRREVGERGVSKAARFSWDETARRVSGVLSGVARQRRPQ
jgi:glycosyltransferase involved in cell wall biosynthesis